MGPVSVLKRFQCVPGLAPACRSGEGGFDLAITSSKSASCRLDLHEDERRRRELHRRVGRGLSAPVGLRGRRQAISRMRAHDSEGRQANCDRSHAAVCRHGSTTQVPPLAQNGHQFTVTMRRERTGYFTVPPQQDKPQVPLLHERHKQVVGDEHPPPRESESLVIGPHQAFVDERREGLSVPGPRIDTVARQKVPPVDAGREP